MPLYENTLWNNYEEIQTWYPAWYREILEMDALWQTYGKQLDEIQTGLVRAVDNTFIKTMDSRTASDWEKFIGIVYDGPRSLAERRNIVKAFFLGQGHIGQKEIRELISVFTNGKIDIKLIKGAIQITVTHDLSDSFNLYDCHLVLDHLIPGHLSLSLVDDSLPMKFINRERFVFRNLNIKFKVNERENGLKGIRPVNFNVKSVFKNYGYVERGLMLNGENNLDGTYMLNGVRFKIFSGITTRSLTMSAFKIQNKFGASVSAGFRLRTANPETFQLADFEIKTRVKNNFKGMNAKQVSMAGYSVKNTFGLTGTLTKSGTLKLNGNFKLDGSQKLNGKFIIKEEI